MKKKGARKPKRRRKRRVSRVPLSPEDANTEKILIENFVALQRVMTHLSEKFDNLASQISKMLNLFEISAKALAEKELDSEKDNTDLKKAIEKLDNLLEQNKIIAKGLIFLHEGGTPPERSAMGQLPPKTIEPKREIRPFAPLPGSPAPSERYQKSISSEKEEPSSLQSKFRPPSA